MNKLWVASVLALTVAAPLVVGCHCATCSRSEGNKEIVRRYIREVINTGDVKDLDRFIPAGYTEVHENKRYPVGPEGARDHVLGVRRAFPDLQLEIENQIAEGDWVATVYTARGTHCGSWLGMRPTGESLEFTGVNVNKTVNGRIVEHGGAANLMGPLLDVGSLRIADSAGGD